MQFVYHVCGMFCSNIAFHNFHVIAMGLQHIIPHFMPLIKKYSWTDWIKKSAKLDLLLKQLKRLKDSGKIETINVNLISSRHQLYSANGRRYLNLYRKSHALTIPDAIIAASAKYKNATLITLNIKHFPMKEIDIVRPY
ncbi:hypothetical protein D2962_05070 [Biomaibacter acetigenes]|uniref:PIN domain-containing protein n=1 Tax=Biomaibacter acetigenes TaxID=2316383 RepID=A0A3G2R407_9FIRM|nr:hypothetical protein D2962_05070 [Biomaibacter acetigenes]